LTPLLRDDNPLKPRAEKRSVKAVIWAFFFSLFYRDDWDHWEIDFMRLTSKGRYAVRAILDLTFNSNGRPVRLQEISERQKISLHYLEQLFRRLRKGSVVKSVRGPGGGYVLSRSMDEISVRDVLTSVGENINPARDLIGTGDIKTDTVEFILTKSYFENLGLIMQEYLTTTSVGDLIRKARGTTQDAARGATQVLENTGFQIPAATGAAVNVGKGRDLS